MDQQEFLKQTIKCRKYTGETLTQFRKIKEGFLEEVMPKPNCKETQKINLVGEGGVDSAE